MSDSAHAQSEVPRSTGERDASASALVGRGSCTRRSAETASARQTPDRHGAPSGSASGRSTYYGAFAFGTVVLAGFGNFLTERQFFGSAASVLVAFLLGAVYVSLGILSGAYDELRHRKAALYYLVQCALLTAIIVLSPVRGFIVIIVLPVVSQSIFDLSRRGWSTITLYLFALTIAVAGGPWGWHGLAQAAMSYATAFVFTIAFTFITRQAVEAHRREAELRAEVEAANAQLRAYAAQAEELATVRERNRLAREIHDGVGHYLTVIKTQLDVASALIPGKPEQARETIVKAAKLSGDALDDVRRSIGSLRTDVARPALPEALRALGEESGIPVSLRVEGVVRPLSPAVEHALFRSAQEGLTNVRKHAGATAAEVALEFRAEGRVALSVRDRGRGAGAVAGSGFGLRGIRERVELLGGRVETASPREGGFALNIEVPA